MWYCYVEQEICGIFDTISFLINAPDYNTALDKAAFMLHKWYSDEVELCEADEQEIYFFNKKVTIFIDTLTVIPVTPEQAISRFLEQ